LFGPTSALPTMSDDDMEGVFGEKASAEEDAPEL
jgi:hypothetical protein